MSFYDEMRAIADELRNIASPSELDQIRHQVTIRTRTWSGGARGLGTSSDSDFALPQKFRVDLMKVAEISTSGGLYEVGDVVVRHITPNVGTDSIGFTKAQLKPSVTSNAVELIYVISGPHAGTYRLVELRTWKNYSWELVLRRDTAQP